MYNTIIEFSSIVNVFAHPTSLKKSIASLLRLMELLKDPLLTFKKIAELLNPLTNTITKKTNRLSYQP